MRDFKGYRLLLLGIVIPLLITGCRVTSAPSNVRPEFPWGGTVPTLIGAIQAPANTPFASLNQELAQALRQAKNTYGFRIQSISSSDFLTLEEALRYFGENQAKLVFIADPSVKQLIPRLSELYPSTRFVMLGLTDTQTNNAKIVGAYLAGAMAGSIAPNGKIVTLFPPNESNAITLEQAVREGIGEVSKKAALSSVIAGTNVSFSGDVLIAMHPSTLPIISDNLTKGNQGIALLYDDIPVPAGFWVIQGTNTPAGGIYEQIQNVILSNAQIPTTTKSQWDIYVSGSNVTQNLGRTIKRPLPQDIALKMEAIRQKIQKGEIQLPAF